MEIRIGVMADIHGNLEAFEAALKHFNSLSADGLIIAGDIVNGSPDSNLCWELAVSLGVPILRGNHERYVGYFGTETANSEWSTDRFAPVQWSAGQFTAEQQGALRALPLLWHLDGMPDVLFCHSSFRAKFCPTKSGR